MQCRDPVLRELLGDWLRRHPQVGAVVFAADGSEPSNAHEPGAADAVIIDASDPELTTPTDTSPANTTPTAIPTPTSPQAPQTSHATAATSPQTPQAAPATTPLTSRELDVLRLLSLGRRSLEIGSVLGVSAHTVENHKRRIFAKLGARSETQAVAEALRRGLVRRPPAPGAARLTPRESEIINLAAAGNSVKQTARALNISVKTVESIQSHLFRKLGVSGRTGAVAVVYGRDERDKQDESSNSSGP